MTLFSPILAFSCFSNTHFDSNATNLLGYMSQLQSYLNFSYCHSIKKGFQTWLLNPKFIYYCLFTILVSTNFVFFSDENFSEASLLELFSQKYLWLKDQLLLEFEQEFKFDLNFDFCLNFGGFRCLHLLLGQAYDCFLKYDHHFSLFRM